MDCQISANTSCGQRKDTRSRTCWGTDVAGKTSPSFVNHRLCTRAKLQEGDESIHTTWSLLIAEKKYSDEINARMNQDPNESLIPYTYMNARDRKIITEQIEINILEFFEFFEAMPQRAKNMAPKELFLHDVAASLLGYNAYRLYSFAVNQTPPLTFSKGSWSKAIRRSVSNVKETAAAAAVGAIVGGTAVYNLGVGGILADIPYGLTIMGALVDGIGFLATSFVGLATSAAVGATVYIVANSISEKRAMDRAEANVYTKVNAEFDKELLRFRTNEESKQTMLVGEPISVRRINILDDIRQLAEKTTTLSEVCRRICRDRENRWKPQMDAIIYSNICRVIKWALPHSDRLDYLKDDLDKFSRAGIWKGNRFIRIDGDAQLISHDEWMMKQYFFPDNGGGNPSGRIIPPPVVEIPAAHSESVQFVSEAGANFSEDIARYVKQYRARKRRAK